MKYDIDNLNKKLNNIQNKKDILNDELKDTIDYIADIDETNQTRELKYSMYDGFERMYQIENDKYHDLIGKYSDAYLEMSDFYVGPDLPRDDFKKNLIDIYLFANYVVENIDTKNGHEMNGCGMNEYDVD